MVSVKIHVLLTCTLSLIMIARVVFRKRYCIKEGIEQGLLKHNLVPIQILKQIKQMFDVFSYQHYTQNITKRLLNEIKEENQVKT